MLKIYRDPVWLHRLYWEERYSTTAMAKIAGCTHGTILYWMKRSGIERRGHPESAALIEYMPFEDRFWSKVNIGEDSKCWEWRGARLPRGYGKFGVRGAGSGWQLAHRVAWELAYDKIPEGLCVCHHCDNPSCVNPSHLFLGTYADNNADMAAKGRRAQAPTAKISETDVLEIRRLYAGADLGYQEIGEMFGVCAGTVGRIVRRDSWDWL